MVLHYVAEGLTTLLGNAQSAIFLVVGSCIGLLIGVIPGLGGPVIMSIVVAFAYHLSVPEITSLFLAVLAGSYYSASITSILLNTPAHPEAFAVTFDGFPMAQRGEAGRALGISASSTLIGGLIGCVALVGLLQFVNQLSVAFHPPEYVALIALALVLVSTLGTDSVSKALTSAGLGIVLASVGESYVTGLERYTFNSSGLLGGINLISLVLGLLAIPQMLLLFGTATKVAAEDMMGRKVAVLEPAKIGKGYRKQSISGFLEPFHRLPVLMRSAVIGVVTGVIPGIGGFAANFLSYSISEQMSKGKRRQFGTGTAEGIIAAEGSSLSKEAGGLIPLLGLGIPGGVGSALFLAVLALKNIVPGYGFVKHYPVLTYEMVWIIAIGGLIGTLGGLLITPGLAQITRVPALCIVPMVMTLVVIGTFAAEGSMFVVGEMVVFIILGFVLRRLKYSLPAVVIGVVLGTTFESNVYLTTKVFPGFSFLWRQPLADVIFLLALIAVAWKGMTTWRDYHSPKTIHKDLSAAESVKSAEENSVSFFEPSSEHLGTKPPSRVETIAMNQTKTLDDSRVVVLEQANPKVSAKSLSHPVAAPHSYPFLSFATSICLSALGIFVILYGMLRYDKATFLMPAIGGLTVAMSSLSRIPGDTRAFVRFLKSRGGTRELTPKTETITTPLFKKVGPRERSQRLRSFVSSRFSRSSDIHEIVLGGWGIHGQHTRELSGFIWFLFLAVVCYVFGFYVGIPAFLLLYGFLATRRVFRNWTRRLIFAVITALIMTLVAQILLSDLLHLAYTPLLVL